MRKFALACLVTASAVAGCTEPNAPPPATRAEANAGLAVATPAGAACGTYGVMDRDGNGHISHAEWDAYRAGAYTAWDVNHDGRISRSEFQNCWYGGGFYPATAYNRDYWNYYYNAFDPNNTGYITADDFFGNRTWGAIDRNNNGVIDDDEWTFWPR
jgi:hypothetical protein